METFDIRDYEIGRRAVREGLTTVQLVKEYGLRERQIRRLVERFRASLEPGGPKLVGPWWTRPDPREPAGQVPIFDEILNHIMFKGL